MHLLLLIINAELKQCKLISQQFWTEKSDPRVSKVECWVDSLDLWNSLPGECVCACGVHFLCSWSLISFLSEAVSYCLHCIHKASWPTRLQAFFCLCQLSHYCGTGLQKCSNISGFTWYDCYSWLST